MPRDLRNTAVQSRDFRGKSSTLLFLALLCASAAPQSALQWEIRQMLNMSICRAVRARVQKKKVKMFSGRSPSKLSNKATWRSLCRVTFEILPSRALIFEGNPSHSDSGLLAGPFTIGIPIIISQKHHQNHENPDFEISKNMKNTSIFIFLKKKLFFS